MDSADLLKINIFLALLFLSLNNDDERDAYYIKGLIGLGAIAGVFSFLTPPTCPPPPVTPTPPPVTPPPVTPPPVTPPPVTPPPVTPPPPPVTPPQQHTLKPSDFTVELVDYEPYHAGNVLFKRCYKNILAPLNQLFIKRCLEKLTPSEFKNPARKVHIYIGKFKSNCFVGTTGIVFNNRYLEELYVKHAIDNNVDTIRQNFLNEMEKAYLDFAKLSTGQKIVDVRTTLVNNVSDIRIIGRLRELVDNRDIHGFAAKNIGFTFKHLFLDDPNYVNFNGYKNYKALLAPIGIPETDYYLMVAREVSNLLNPGDIKTALDPYTKLVTIELATTSAAASVTSYGVIGKDGIVHGADKKKMIINKDMLNAYKIDDKTRQRLLDIIFHETSHCVDQAYPGKSIIKRPSFYAEGIATWCQQKIKGNPWKLWPKPKVADWRQSYDTFAAFYEYVDRNSPSFSWKFYHTVINQGYKEENIKIITGKTGDEWWKLYLNNPDSLIV